MEINRVGKFEVRRIINEFDAALIRSYGVNMLDVKITRQQALLAIEETGTAQDAADLCARRLQLPRLPEGPTPK